MWTCWDCLVDIAARKSKLPTNACANDSWIGRESLHVREACLAKMLASLGRCCWKQVRLGRDSDPAFQEKALTGNTIFFAQPTADVPSMEVPPLPDAMVDSLNVIFTQSLHDLSKAEWASVDREQCFRISEERKLQCLAFSNVQVRHDLAATLSRVGVPEHISACAREVHSSERAPVHLQGSVLRGPETDRDDEAGDTSEEHSDDEDCEDKHRDGPEDDEAEASNAADPIHDVQPVKMMQALQGNIEALQNHAATIVRNEKTPDTSAWSGESGYSGAHAEAVAPDMEAEAPDVSQKSEEHIKTFGRMEQLMPILARSNRSAEEKNTVRGVRPWKRT